MNLELDFRGADQFIDRSKTFRSKLPGRVLIGMGASLQSTVSVIRENLGTKSGLGRTLRRMGEDHFAGTVVPIEARAKDGAIETGVKLKGLAVAIESGGRLKPHSIKGKPRMVFEGKSGLVVTGLVQHPGATVRRHDIAVDELRRDMGSVSRSVEAQIQKLIGEVFG